MCLVLFYSLIFNIYIIFKSLIVYGFAGNCMKEERVRWVRFPARLGSGSDEVTGHFGKENFGILGFCAVWMQTAQPAQADAQGLWETGHFLEVADFSYL